MTHRERLRRVAKLCCHFLRNLAFYRSGWRNGSLIVDDPFWTNVNGNFLDICVLEWCKLFGDSRGKHHWRKVITDEQAFRDGLFRAIAMTEVEFAIYIDSMKTYRDKFVAHLDEQNRMDIPDLTGAQASASFLYDYLLSYEEEGDCFYDAPRDAARFYRKIFRTGRTNYVR